MRTSPFRCPALLPAGDRLALYVFLFMLIAGTLFVTATKAQEPLAPPVAVAREEDGLPRGHSVIRGRAVYDDTGRPVRRARVMLLNTELMASSPTSMRGGLTDGRGEFRIADVPAGSYLIAVDAPGFISPVSFLNIETAGHEYLSSGLPDLTEIKKHFDEVSVDGTNETVVTVRARRGGAITGRVAYADGDPVIGVAVSVMRRQDGRWAHLLTGFNPTAIFGIRTDDRGRYRISGLPPGEYIVSVIEAISHTSGGRGSAPGGMEIFFESAFSGGSPLAVTYHQAATRPGGATPLQVEAGQELSDINITVVVRESRTISGTVVARRGGQPLANAHINLQPRDQSPVSLPPFMRGGSEIVRTQTDELGQWTFREIPDGAYIITVEPPMEFDPETQAMMSSNMNVSIDGAAPVIMGNINGSLHQPRRRYARRQQEVTVDGGDLTGVVIQMAEGGSISGTVTLEGATPAPRSREEAVYRDRARPPQIHINAFSLGEAHTIEGGTSVIAGDSPFSITGLRAGRIYLSVGSSSIPGEFYARSATWNGRDLLREPLELEEGAAITGVRIVLSAEVARLTGRMLSAQERRPVAGARLLLVPADPGRWRFRGDYLFGSAEENGRFAVQGAPGEYLVIALAPGSRAFEFTEAAIRERASTAQRVSLRAGAEQTLDVIVPAGSR